MDSNPLDCKAKIRAAVIASGVPNPNSASGVSGNALYTKPLRANAGEVISLVRRCDSVVQFDVCADRMTDAVPDQSL